MSDTVFCEHKTIDSPSVPLQRWNCGRHNDMHWMVETKGAETIEVPYKDRAARLWCENTTMLTGTTWDYIKVRQTEFYELHPAVFSDITLMR